MFFDEIKIKIHKFIMLVYNFIDKFPKCELYGVSSQLRRAAISIMLNFVEGFARFKPKVKLNFFETSYGSVKECKYLLFFSKEKGWITVDEYKIAFKMIDEIGAALWKIIAGLENEIRE